MCVGEKQAATHVSLDQEYDQDLAAMWCQLEEQLVASANRGIVPVNFLPTQFCLNSKTDNLRNPLAVVEGKRSWQTWNLVSRLIHIDSTKSDSCLS